MAIKFVGRYRNGNWKMETSMIRTPLGKGHKFQAQITGPREWGTALVTASTRELLFRRVKEIEGLPYGNWEREDD